MREDVHIVTTHRQMERRPWLELRGSKAPPDDLSDAAALCAFWHLRLPTTSFAYFIQAQQGTPIKIGIAVDVLGRLAQFQTANPQELHVIGVLPGGRELEARLHQALQGERVRGEWFKGPETSRILARAWEHSDRSVDHFWQTGELLPTLDVEPPAQRRARHKWRNNGPIPTGRLSRHT